MSLPGFTADAGAKVLPVSVACPDRTCHMDYDLYCDDEGICELRNPRVHCICGGSPLSL